jgi:hypothetical protein
MGVTEKSVDTFREPMQERRAWEKLLPWLGAVVLAAGIIAAIVRFVPSTNGNTGSAAPPQSSAPRAQQTPKKVPLSSDARQVAGTFILTAVHRKNLDKAWKISGPEIRQDLTYKQWLTGNIPVVPYLEPTSVTPMKIDISQKNYALVEVAMIPKDKAHASQNTELFWLELKRVGKGSNAHWLVWSWTPDSPPATPANPSGG